MTWCRCAFGFTPQFYKIEGTLECEVMKKTKNVLLKTPGLFLYILNSHILNFKCTPADIRCIYRL